MVKVKTFRVNEKRTFVLALHRDPLSIEVYRNDMLVPQPEIGRLDVGQERRVQLETGQFLDVTILSIGTQTAQKAIKVTRQGTIWDGHTICEFLGSRYAETHRPKRAEKSARQATLDNIALSVTTNNGQSALSTLAQSRPPSASRAPLKRRASYVDSLQQKMDTMNEMLQLPASGDMLIWPTYPYRANSADLLFIKQNHDQQPSTMFRQVIELCIPAEILDADGVSVTGARGTVGIPENLVKSINAYVQANSSGWKYCPTEVLRNYLDKRTRRLEAHKRARVDPQTSGQDSQEVTQDGREAGVGLDMDSAEKDSGDLTTFCTLTNATGTSLNAASSIAETAQMFMSASNILGTQ